MPSDHSAPEDGSLPGSATEGLGTRPFGFYVHVPFCRVRCGYCDFNTYTATELGDVPGASRASYADAAIEEVRFARKVLGDADLEVQTVFFGGGTPTLLDPADLARVVAAVDDEFGLAADAEVTTESNPDSVDAGALARLREGGVNRVSFGMQSAVPHVLAVLDRTHDPERVPRVVDWARQAACAVRAQLETSYHPSPAPRRASSAARYLSARSSSSGPRPPGTSPRRTCRASAVPSSTIRAYAERWSGSQASAAASDVDQSSSDSPGVP